MAVRQVAYWRLTHERDVVPLVPSRNLGFAHLQLQLSEVPELHSDKNFDLGEDEGVDLDMLINGRRGCGQLRSSIEPLPPACPIGSST
jgi:hypothetical protein